MSHPEIRAAATKPASKGRRRFLRAGTAATPALVSLVSTPALGATCFTPSRNLSQNTSLSQSAYIGTCTGSSVATYALGTGWPSSAPTTTAFHPLFSGDHFYVKNNSGNNSNGLRSCTLLEVLKINSSTLAAPSNMVWSTASGVYRSSFLAVTGTSGTDTVKVAQHMVAAYLNCLAAKVPANVLKAAGTHPSCTLMWSDFQVDGTYEVMASVLWNPAQIIDYLISNGIAPAT